MKLAKIITLAAIASCISGAAMADSHHHDTYIHGSAHHAHADGNWHGVKTHRHNGTTMHRGHSHEAPAKQCTHKASSCDLKNVKNNYDLQRCRVKNAGNHPRYYEFFAK